MQAVNGVGPSTPSEPGLGQPGCRCPDAGDREVASDGGVFSFGNAGSFGSAASLALNHPVVGLAPTHDRQGYGPAALNGIFN